MAAVPPDGSPAGHVGPIAAAEGPDASTSNGVATEPAPSLDYQELYEQIKHKPCRVVRLERLDEGKEKQLRTKAHLIDRELQAVHDAQNLEEIHTALEQAGRNLEQLNVFSRVEILVNEEPEDDPEACTVLLDLQEKNWYKAQAATYFQGGESTLETGVGLSNVTGHAEHISLSMEQGTQRSSTFALTYEQPRPWGLPLMFEARAHKHNRNHVKASSFEEKLRGGLLAVRSMDGRHNLQYELGWRSLVPDIQQGASQAVVAQAGEYIKGAARYSFYHDRRDNPLSPTSGWAVRTTSEVAGLGPGSTPSNLRYVRQQVDLQVVLPLLLKHGLTLNLAASAGAMAPWGGDAPLSRPTCIADRFYLGGPSTLRGFKFKGVGPTAQRRGRTSTGAEPSSADGAGARRDALGGDLYSSVLAELVWNIPHKAARAVNIQAHAFVNGGNCVALAGAGAPVKDTLQHFGATFRWSAGVGLVLPTWFGRFEANYVHVLASQEHDRVKQGIQLGFAASLFS